MIALGYSRRSKEATERTVSFEDWQARIAAYAAERGWQLIEVLVDDGVSGCSVSQSAAGRRGPGS